MSRALNYLLVILVAGLGGCQKKKADIVYDRNYLDQIKSARKEAYFFMARNNVPGASFAVSVNGKLVYSEALGLASKDLDVPATRQTKFRIGHVSELFTSMIYQLLIEEGKLNPDSTVQYYIKNYPKTNFRLELQNLAYQTSGLRQPAGKEIDWRGLNVSIQQGVTQFANDSLVSPPGWFQKLNMYNYNLLGAVMEKVTGKHFHNILKNYITDTLHLENTVVDHPLITIKNRSDYYDLNMVAQVVNATFRDMRYRAPSQGLLSTAEDLVKFGDAVLYSDYIPQSVKDRLFEPVNLLDDIPSSMANGWMILYDRVNNQKMYGRSGTVTGGSAAILIYPDENIVVASSCNLSLNSEDIPVFPIARCFLPQTEKENQAGNNKSDSKQNNLPSK